jgi:hypothetical protein
MVASAATSCILSIKHSMRLRKGGDVHCTLLEVVRASLHIAHVLRSGGELHSLAAHVQYGKVLNDNRYAY